MENLYLKGRNLALLMDFYELTMASGYLKNKFSQKTAVFDMFFRGIPDGGGYAIAAGLEQLCELIDEFSFTASDIEYLQSLKMFDDDFLQYLVDFKFSCSVFAVEEGRPVFPNEPLVTVEGPAIEAQLIETMLLTTINHQSLIATKAARIARAADGRGVMEFGARRAQSYDASVLGARAAYIGGASSTSNVLAGKHFGIPIVGTMAHSWVQMFESEYEAFECYAKCNPDNCTLLVDTYNVLKSGVPNAIKAFNDILKPLGKRPKGIRIDSGDIAYLSKNARVLLDNAGYTDVKISASNSLNENILKDLLLQGAKVDVFGIGENLITAKSDPVFGGVYKLVATKENGVYTPKIKLSETVEKMTIPHRKNIFRLYDKNNMATADLLTMHDEPTPQKGEITLFDPSATWKKRVFEVQRAENIQKPIYIDGKKVYTCPKLADVKAFCEAEKATLWDEVRRFENPHKYYVDLSQKLWDERERLLCEINNKLI